MPERVIDVDLSDLAVALYRLLREESARSAALYTVELALLADVIVDLQVGGQHGATLEVRTRAVEAVRAAEQLRHALLAVEAALPEDADHGDPAGSVHSPRT